MLSPASKQFYEMPAHAVWRFEPYYLRELSTPQLYVVMVWLMEIET